MARYLLGLSCLLWSCTDSDPIKRRNDHEYFPLQVGYFQIYSVTHTTYAGLDQHTTEEYELRTEIVDSFESPEGSTIFVIHRSKRASEGDDWEFMDTWSARIAEFEAIMNEGNTSFVKIAFPADVNKQWNGNSLNFLPEDIYQLDELGVPISLEDGQSFDDCIVISQEEYTDDTFKDERQEIYALNVGLIYKSTIDIVYCNDGIPYQDGGCVGLYKIESGYEFLQVLKEYGQN